MFLQTTKIPSIWHKLNLNPSRCGTAWNTTILGIPPASRGAEQCAAPWDEATDTHNSCSGNAKHDQTQRRKLPGWSCLLSSREPVSCAVPSPALPAAAAQNRLQDPRGMHSAQAGHWEVKGRAQHLLLLPSVPSVQWPAPRGARQSCSPSSRSSYRCWGHPGPGSG